MTALPDESLDRRVMVEMTVREFREWLHGRAGVPEWVSTTQASRYFGRSRKFWERAAPDIDGAWQEEEGAPWTLPARACRAHLEALARKHSPSEAFKRGPQLRRAS